MTESTDTQPTPDNQPTPAPVLNPALLAPPAPTPGRIVLYVVDHGSTRGERRPAIVLGRDGEKARLHVFLSVVDGSGNASEVSAPEGTDPGCWHWPPRA